MKDETVYFKHIFDAIKKIQSYTSGGRKAFFQNTIVQDAVIRNLEIIGEAVRHLSPEFRQRIPRYHGGASQPCEMCLFTNISEWSLKSYGGSSKDAFPASSSMSECF